MNTSNTPTRIICATSWNGTEFVYNVQNDTWQMMDNVTIGSEHHATEDFLADAENCRIAENCAFVTAARIEDYIDPSADL